MIRKVSNCYFAVLKVTDLSDVVVYPFQMWEDLQVTAMRREFLIRCTVPSDELSPRVGKMVSVSLIYRGRTFDLEAQVSKSNRTDFEIKIQKKDLKP